MNAICKVDEIRHRFESATDYDALCSLQNELLGTFDGAAQMAPDDLLLLAAILRRRGEWSEAARILRRRFNEFPGRYDLGFQSMLYWIDVGGYKEAVALSDILYPMLQLFSERQLRGMWRASALIGRHEIALKALQLSEDKNSPFCTPSIRRRIDQAVLNYKTYDCPIISIGENCLPWMLVNRWGLRRDPHSSANDTIFNLGQTRIPGVVDIVRALGEGIISDDNLEVRHTPSGVPYPRNFKFRYDFNHEVGEEWLSNDYYKLKSRYAHRTNSFQQFLSGGPRVFVYYCEKKADLSCVIEALSEANSDKNYRVVIIDASPGIEDANLSSVDKVFFKKVSMPTPDYVWFKPDDFDSDHGIEFEGEIAQIITKAIDDLDTNIS